MAHTINEECISCGACETECPDEAISEGEEIFIIDAAKCTDCGTCVEFCPVDAIIAPE
jgi:ferredoxin